MTPFRTQAEIQSLHLSLKAKQVAEDLGFSPEGGKAGGVILLVVDGGNAMVAHAGDRTPMFMGLRMALDKMLRMVAEHVSGGERPWRKTKDQD